MHTDKHRHASIHAYMHIRRDRDRHTDIKKTDTHHTDTDRQTHARTHVRLLARAHAHTHVQTDCSGLNDSYYSVERSRVENCFKLENIVQ